MELPSIGTELLVLAWEQPLIAAELTVPRSEPLPIAMELSVLAPELALIGTELKPPGSELPPNRTELPVIGTEPKLPASELPSPGRTPDPIYDSKGVICNELRLHSFRLCNFNPP